jgi:hypothetical protein
VPCKDLESRVKSNADALCAACGKSPTEQITLRSVITLLNKSRPGDDPMLTRGGQYPDRHYQLDNQQLCTLVDRMVHVLSAPLLLPNGDRLFALKGRRTHGDCYFSVVPTLPLPEELKTSKEKDPNWKGVLIAYDFQKKIYAAETDSERLQLWKQYLNVAKRPLVGDDMNSAQ